MSCFCLGFLSFSFLHKCPNQAIYFSTATTALATSVGAFAGLVLLTLSVWGGVRLCRFRRAIINVAPLIPGHPIPMGFHPVGFQNPAGPSVSPPSRPAGSSSSAAAGTSPIPQGIPAAPSGPAASVGPAAPSVGDSSLLADFLRDEQAASRTAADVVSFYLGFWYFPPLPGRIVPRTMLCKFVLQIFWLNFCCRPMSSTRWQTPHPFLLHLLPPPVLGPPKRFRSASSNFKRRKSDCGANGWA